LIFELHDSINLFPDPSLAEDSGLLAVGGDLQPARLITAYENGIFPWYSEGEPIYWYSPPMRCVIFPGEIIVSKSMHKILASGFFKIKHNTAFEEVIENCKTVNRAGQSSTWITEDMKEAYTKLYFAGIAQSVEVYKKDKLVGGLYGIVINNVFCGESMFSKVSNASKAALVWLCRNGGNSLIDCQLPNKHLLSMGAVMISRNAYIQILQNPD
jgi:leucyl/phenylalanyl-tRNA--protein transferase